MTEWLASDYNRQSSLQQAMADEQLRRLTLKGGAASEARGTKTALVCVLLLGIVFFVVLSRKDESPPVPVSSERSLEMISAGEIASYRTHGYDLLLLGDDGKSLVVSPPISARLWQELAAARVPYGPESDSGWTSAVLPVAVVALAVLALLYFLSRMRGGSGPMGNIFELRRSKARPVAEQDKARFSDIGGSHSAVELVGDVVDFLRAPLGVSILTWPLRWADELLRATTGG